MIPADPGLDPAKAKLIELIAQARQRQASA